MGGRGEVVVVVVLALNYDFPFNVITLLYYTLQFD